MKIIKAKPSVPRPMTEDMLDAAIKRGETRQASSLQAVSVSFEKPSLVIRFDDGSGVLLPVDQYPEFDGFEAGDYEGVTVGFAGTALCHEGKDLDVSIAGMISASPSLMRMAASVVASRNGRQSSAAKSEAARANGKKGGRPRKTDIAP
ncbi:MULTISPECIES: DUF2442 domain-containing protein [unclassified Pseudomonas]|jgi:hypothetical protein|uniref:DUF2442 domain-containing protein n=1 Tax=unclassified Pseudomonas TaxID=196821 RepID=UPI000C85935D|nr:MULTISPECIES: DUF2442 domain-containing protein [unclassified Pseudomonas]MDX9671149.1 DUF2442 domain-containing protein [Pseudomonas sp. P8_250]PMQ13520.1 hypothetical protein PseAD21_03220 [Pseudomonas sp. AD21]WPN34868.1 DUF2442 domain-containing protein [Pseudomonas sp. P8_139]WPN43332.1 DUF2442 domain-containing protein [Pseudomonas sp. P8_229]